MIKIKQQIVSDNVIKRRSFGKGNPVTMIVVHQTGNRNKGAGAQNHANLQSNLNSREASWHIQVDNLLAIQSFPDNIRCWGTGDGSNSLGGNMNGLHVESCINSDADYFKTIDNTAKVVALKMKEHNLGLNNVVRHFDVNRKNCPEQLMRNEKNISWNDFLDLVEIHSGGVGINKLVVDGFMGYQTISELQRYFGTIVDGKISRPSLVIRSLQNFLNNKRHKLVVDGSFGPATIRALQSYFGTIVDGRISKPSNVIKELQRRLNKGIL